MNATVDDEAGGRMLWQLLTLARVTLQEALKSRYFLLVFAILLSGVLLGGVLGQVAITESRQIERGFVAAFFRLGVIFSITLLILSGISREFNDGTIMLYLSLPMRRATYLLGKLLGLAGIGVIAVAMAMLSLLIFAPWQPLLIWSLSLYLETLIVSGFAILCVITFQQIPQSFAAVAGFYLLSRSLHALQMIGTQQVMESESLFHDSMLGFIDLLGYILPALDTFTRSEWLIHSIVDPARLLPLLIQTLIYLSLLTLLALFDLYRKDL
ncbi:MAG: ABC transporter permease subunit [Gammaproteobacteria bacterium]|nr:ABC transporter permease subunit [Gammaproteobacteria bacterium]